MIWLVAFIPWLLCFFTSTASTPILAESTAKVRTFPFQDFGPSGVPKGWRDDTAWADVDKSFGTDHVSEEQQVAKITLNAVRRGRMQMLGPSVPLKGGQVYTIRIRMKAQPTMPVEVGLREQKPPYQTWAIRKTIQAGPEWRVDTFSFEVPSSLPDDRLLISFGQPGILWLDSIQIVEETRAQFAERIRREAPVGNLVPNGSFRLGQYGWTTLAQVDRISQYPLYTGHQYSLEPPRFRVEKKDGQALGVLELTNWRSILLSNLFPVKTGLPFEGKAKVRRRKGSGPVSFKLFSPSWEKAPATSLGVGTEWTELKLSGISPIDLQLRYEISASGGIGGDELDIASISFQQHEAERSVLEFAVTADKEMSAYIVGEALNFKIHSAGLGTETKTVKWTLVDADEHTIRSGEWHVKDGAVPGKFERLTVGWYQLRWRAPWAAIPEGSLNLAVVPPVERVSATESPWGIHVEGGAQGVEKMRLLGARWLRTNNPLWTKWTAVQPEKNSWIFPDHYVDQFIQAGFGIVGSLDRSPRWAARKPEDDRKASDYMGWKADLPKDWSAWEEYVRQMVRRYKSKITYWEVWNEPDIVFLNPPEGLTNAQAYFQLLEHAAPIIKAENPDAQIIASPAYVLRARMDPKGYQADFTESLIKAGGMRFIDIFAIHHYLQPAERLFDHPERYSEKLNAVRKAMVAVGHKPVLWNSEWGIINFTLSSNGADLPSNNGMTGAQAAQELVTWSTAQLAAGMEKLFWYDGQDNFYYHYHVTKNFFDYRQPRPIFVAYAVLTKALDGLTFQSSRKEGSARIISFDAGQEIVEVAYVPPGGKASIKVKPGLAVLDYLGCPVTPDFSGRVKLGDGPVYFLSKKRAAMILGR